MDLSQIIKQGFEAEVKNLMNSIKKPQLIPFLLQHERRAKFEERLRLEIFGGELRHGAKMNIARVNKLIQGGVVLFAKLAVQHKIEQLESPAARALRVQNAGKEKEAAGWYEEEQRKLASTAISKSLYIPDGKAKEDTGKGSEEGPAPTGEGTR